jgi:hypothetical protein
MSRWCAHPQKVINLQVRTVSEHAAGRDSGSGCQEVRHRACKLNEAHEHTRRKESRTGVVVVQGEYGAPHETGRYGCAEGYRRKALRGVTVTGIDIDTDIYTEIPVQAWRDGTDIYTQRADKGQTQP